MDAKDEQPDVLRIRLFNDQRATAMLSEFHSADCVLAGWAARGDASMVGFEVIFLDGLVLRGRHEFYRGGKRRCLFANYVRQLLSRAAGLDAAPAAQALAA